MTYPFGTQSYLQDWAAKQATDAHERYQERGNEPLTRRRHADRSDGDSTVALSEEQARKERIIFAIVIICIFAIIIGGCGYALYWSFSGHGPQ